MYCQEWEIDQLLQYCMHLFFSDFCLGFQSKIFNQNMPLLEGPLLPWNGGAVKPPLQFTLYLPLLGGAYFGEMFGFKNPSKNKKWNINYQFYIKQIIKVYRKTHKNMQNMCKNPNSQRIQSADLNDTPNPKGSPSPHRGTLPGAPSPGIQVDSKGTRGGPHIRPLLYRVATCNIWRQKRFKIILNSR